MNTNKQTGDTTMNESYKDKFNATMKQFGIDSLDDLKSDEEKKKFFKAVDKSHTAANESVAEELMTIAEETINEMKEGGKGSGPQMKPGAGTRGGQTDDEADEYDSQMMGEMMKEMMKEMDKMPEMKMLKAETDPTKVEMMKKEMMKEMMKEMAEMSEMSETMKKEMMKEMSKKMNEYGSMNAMKEGLTAGQKKLPPALQKAIAAKQDKKETVSPAQQAAIAISKKEKKEELEEGIIGTAIGGAAGAMLGGIPGAAIGAVIGKTATEKHVPGHKETAVNAMAMNAMKKETARKEMMMKMAMKMPIRAMKTGDDDMTPDALKLNAMIKDPHKSREENPKKDLNATYMKSDVRADVKNGGGTDMSKVQDAPKMMTAMKKISAMYKTEKYHETKPGSIHDTVAQMQMNEQKIVSIKVKEFTKMVETYLLKGGVIDTTSVNEDVDLNEEINALHLNEVRGFIETYNKWFLTNYRAEEFIISEKVDAAGAMGAEPKKVGTIAKIAKGISYATQPIRNFIKGKGMKMDIDVKKKEYPAGSVGARTKTNVFGVPKKNQ